MELHIWGPAFGLPSIDPECLAAIAYLRCIPELNPRPRRRTDNGIYNDDGVAGEGRLWTIVPSSNPLLSPTRTLPALRDNGIWIGGGFNGIIDYLRTKSKGLWDLDRDLRHPGADPDSYDYENDQDPTSNPIGSTSYTYAESVAYSSFIRSRLGPLLDISLYVSDVNYSRVTRPEYSKHGMLPWPVQYYVPGQKRAEVWERCEEVLRRFGLSTKDVDPIPLLDSLGRNLGVDTNAVGAGVSGNGGAGGISSIFGRKPSASTAGVVFKLQTLISKSLTPVAARLVAADSDPSLGVYFFKRQTPTSIDCLILGYICLAIFPELPNSFLSEGIKELDEGRGGRRFYAWTHEFRRKVFGSMPIDENRILNPENQDLDQDLNQNKSHEEIKKDNNTILPWGKPEKADLPWLTGQFLSSAGDYLNTYLPTSLTTNKLFSAQKPESGTPPDIAAAENLQKAAKRKERLVRIAAVFVGVGTFLAFLVSNGVIAAVSVEENEESEGDVTAGDGDDDAVEKELEQLEKEEESRGESQNQNQNNSENRRDEKGGREGVDVDVDQQEIMTINTADLGLFDPPTSPPPPPPPDAQTSTSHSQPDPSKSE